MKSKSILFGAIGLILILILFILLKPASGSAILKNFEGNVEFHKSMSCGCCGIHSNYLENKGLNLNIINMEDVSPIKKEYGVPSALESCHTTIIGDYFVEGHMPVEAIEKLLKEKPDIAGIALPGMPSGSPGMPGPKRVEWVVYAVNKDGTYDEFMRILSSEINYL